MPGSALEQKKAQLSEAFLVPLSLSPLTSEFGIFASLVLRSVLLGELALGELAVHVSLVIGILVHVDFWRERGIVIVVLIC